METKTRKFKSLIFIFFLLLTKHIYGQDLKLDTYVQYVDIDKRTVADTLYYPLSLTTMSKGVITIDDSVRAYNVVEKYCNKYRNISEKKLLRKNELENLYFQIPSEFFSENQKYLLQITNKKESEKHLYIFNYYDFIIDMDSVNEFDTIKVKSESDIYFKTKLVWEKINIWEGDTLRNNRVNKFNVEKPVFNIDNLLPGVYSLRFQTYYELLEYYLLVEDK